MNDNKKLPYPSELPPPSYEVNGAPSISAPKLLPLNDGDLDSQLNSLTARTVAMLPIQYQPSAQTTMLLVGGGGTGGVGGNRNPLFIKVGLDGKREWSHTLFSGIRERPASTALACCFPCCKYSNNRSRLVYLTKNGEPNESPVNCGLFTVLYAIAPQFLGIGSVALQCLSRYTTRQRYGIRGDIVQDTLVGAFCVPCTLVQEAREIEEEERALLKSRLDRSQEAQMNVNFRDEEEAVVGAVPVDTREVVFVVDEGE